MDALTLAVYLAPSILVLYGTRRELSLHHIRKIKGDKTTTLKEWNAVFSFLGITLQNQNDPPPSRSHRPARLILLIVLIPPSLLLLSIPLPITIREQYAQYSWDFLPLVQTLISGFLLAVGLGIAFSRPRRWGLSLHDLPVDYPMIKWKELEKK
jgi:hypothetical protein